MDRPQPRPPVLRERHKPRQFLETSDFGGQCQSRTPRKSRGLLTHATPRCNTAPAVDSGGKFEVERCVIVSLIGPPSLAPPSSCGGSLQIVPAVIRPSEARAGTHLSQDFLRRDGSRLSRFALGRDDNWNGIGGFLG